MAADYAALKTEIAAFYVNSNISDTNIDTFIDQAEAEMQRMLRLVDFEATGTVTMTSGSGTLPTGFLEARSVSWEGSPDRTLTYVTPERLDAINAANPAYASYYTITGATIKVADDQSGTLNLTYKARFTPLSGSATTNAFITNHPDLYLTGALKWAALYMKDFPAAQGYGGIFTNLIDQIKAEDSKRRHAGQLRVVPA